MLALGLAALVVSAVFIYTPLHLKATMGAGPELNGIVLAAPAMGVIGVSALVASRLAKILGTYQTIAVGFILMALMLVVLPWLDQIRWI